MVALLCEAAFTLLAVPVLRRQSAWGVSFHAVWIGTVMLLVLAVLVDGPRSALLLRVNDWAAIGYLAVMVTAVAFLCWYTCVAIIGSGRAGLLTGSRRRLRPSPARRPSANFRHCPSGWASPSSALAWPWASGREDMNRLPTSQKISDTTRIGALPPEDSRSSY